jgi:hypothetical protein
MERQFQRDDGQHGRDDIGQHYVLCDMDRVRYGHIQGSQRERECGVHQL